jgi:dipeptidase E
MKLYLSSKSIPSPRDLAALIGKPIDAISVALIPNSKDFFAEHARNYLVNDFVTYMKQLGLNVEVVDLRDYSHDDVLKQKLASYDLIWAMGGNTFNLRYEMKRSGFEKIIRELLDEGVVYGGDSAGALVAGISIAGVESADKPQFAEEVITEGLDLVPFFFLPHADSPGYAHVVPVFKRLHQDSGNIIELKDSQVAIFNGDSHQIINSKE